MEMQAERQDNRFFDSIRRGALAGAYLLYGEEEYSKEQAVSQLVGTLSEAVRDLNLIRLKNPSAADVIDACETLPFFDDRRLILVEGWAADCGNALAKYVATVPETALLILLQRGKASGEPFPTLKKLERTVEFAPYDESMAASFAVRCARLLQSPLDRTVARRLVERVGTELAALEGAVGKAAAYAGFGNPITEAAVEKSVTANLEYNVFAMLDRLLAGDKKQGLSMLTGMLQSGESAMGLASFLEGRVRQLLTVKQLQAEGKTEAEIQKTLGGSPYAAKMAVKNAKKCTLPQLTRAVTALSDVDAQQKQGRMRDADALLLAVFTSF